MGIATSSSSPPLDRAAAAREEASFYTRYDWCLNPVLAVGSLFQRLQEELDRAPALAASWQRAESRINVYLFTCAIACTVDDYLSRPLGDWTSIAAHFPRLRFALNLGGRLLQGVQALRSAATDRTVARWRGQWQECVDAACDLLVHASEPGTPRWSECDARIRALSPSGFPARLLRRRMTLPAAFRNQDLTHYDVSVLARRVADARAAAPQPVVVVGLRTAGAYLAPLLKAHLTSCGVAAAWMTLRPKYAPSPGEHRQLRRLQRSGAHVVVVDEPPNSGKTFRLTLDVLARAGVGADRVTVAAPRSPAKADWTLSGEPAGTSGPDLITLDPADYFKARLLDPTSIAPRLREYHGSGAVVSDSAETRALNVHLQAHHKDGFHVRLKRVFRVQRGDEGHAAPGRYVVAKSVGWGWLGYHAYIAGMRLAGLVPRVLGLRDGLLFTEWVGALEWGEARSVPDVSVRTLASYVATRARRLRLAEDPCFDDLDYGRTGWSELVNLLRRAYGRYVGRLKIPALHRRLRALLSPVPALIDGRMRPEEWVVGHGTGLVKADFEHHTFGKTELNVVDPASDLAYATLTFGLCPERERQLVEAYARDSGDRRVGERILFYQLLHGALVMADAFSRASRDRSEGRHDWNRRYVMARNWLTSRLSRFAAGLIPAPASVTWSKRLFFLDLDGVFDAEVLGFPHTTTSGLAALALLRAHDFSVIPHTGRSVADVQSYCRDYALPGGVAELGSVFVDAVGGREMPLIGVAASEQLAKCRAVLAGLDGVFVDPTYRYSVRAYRIAGERTVPPPPGLVEEVLQRAGLDRLAVSPSSVDVVVLARGVDKGHGLTAVRDYLGCAEQAVAAIGDSDRDIPMLAAADFAFAPSGCSPGVRALATQGQCSIMAAPMQRGLLRAARELASLQPGPADRPLSALAPRAQASELMATLLDVAERSQVRRLLGALAWWRL